jgi:hypothetical protein
VSGNGNATAANDCPVECCFRVPGTADYPNWTNRGNDRSRDLDRNSWFVANVGDAEVYGTAPKGSNGHLCRGPSYVEFLVPDVRLVLQRLQPDVCRLRELDIISLVN